MNAISRNKYRAVRTIVDGVAFHSKRESEAWQYLKIRERAGEIKDLKRQVPFELYGSTKDGSITQLICRYVADFQYFDVKKNQTVIADSKGVKTALFILRSKMMKASHGIDVEIV